MKEIFLNIFKHHQKELKGIASGSVIKHKEEVYILFYCDEAFTYNCLPSNPKDWYLYNLNTETIERVNSYNNFILTREEND